MAHLDSVLPETSEFGVEVVKRQLRRQDGMLDVEELPILGVDLSLDFVPEIGAR